MFYIGFCSAYLFFGFVFFIAIIKRDYREIVEKRTNLTEILGVLVYTLILWLPAIIRDCF